MTISPVLLIIALFVLQTSCAQQYPDLPVADTGLSVETVSTDFRHPWSFTFVSSHELLVTEKDGELYSFKNGTKKKVEGMPEVYVRGQGGLMDVIVDPKFEQNQWIYFAYGSSDGQNSGNTTVMRARYSDGVLSDQKVIFKAYPESSAGAHWGGRLAFDLGGYLYISVGDRGDHQNNPQSLSNHSGKIHRIHPDGTIPKDNPYVGKQNHVPSIFSYGHRNPQGMAVHPETDEVWTHEHGPMGGDELNIVRRGLNYGWPVITYGVNYNGTKITDITDKQGMEQPVVYWVPSIAPCGMTFVTSDRYPEWKGSILLGSLRFNYIHRVILEGNKAIHQEKILDGFGRMRSIKESPDGYLYFSVEGKGIFKILPSDKP